ncbi:hypothetical protein C1646_662522 [Rhizophagus diaphanus]|nr:hypothetical protein C1646_662522 [Rhizophagus diaphanus] [Rhizophagus sp. MUCL 43196]
MQISVKIYGIYHTLNEDKAHNNPNLHSEKQDELELPEKITEIMKIKRRECAITKEEWNVATSSARSKVIVITNNKMPCPEDTEIFTNKKMREGWALLNIIES